MTEKVDHASDPSDFPAGDLQERVVGIHERLRLKDVRTERLFGEVFAELPLEIVKVALGMEDPDVLIELPRFACRFALRVKLLNGADDRLVEVDTTVVLEFEMDGEGNPDPEAVGMYVAKNAFFLAYPYLREAVQSVTLRLGLDPVLLGVLSRGDDRPSEVRLIPRLTWQSSVPEG